MADGPYEHVLGCISEVDRARARVDVATRAAVEAIRAGELDTARDCLDEALAGGEAVMRHAKTSLHALSAARDRAGD